MKKLSIALSTTLGLAAVWATNTHALDQAPKQVLIESKLVYVTHKDRDFSVEMAFVMTPLNETSTQVDATAIAFGQGSQYRRWTIESPSILTPDKSIIKPDTLTKIYVPKPSAAAPVAPLLFAAIGTQYEAYGDQAAASPGTTCTAGGSGSSHATKERGNLAGAIDRAGMAAGMGLLTSQAKGELEGVRASFIVPSQNTINQSGVPVLGQIPLIDHLFRAKARNRDKNQLIVFVTPITVMGEKE